MTSGNGAAPAEGARRQPEPTETAPRGRHGDDPHARGHQGHAGRAARRRRAGRRPRPGPGHRPAGAHRQGRRAGLQGERRQRRPPRRRSDRRQADPAQGRERDARALHGRVAADPDRDVLPHLHRHQPRHAPQAAQERRPPRLLHAPDRPRDRARGDRDDAGDGDALRRARRQAARDRRRRRQPRHRGRRREEGRRAHADGARDQGRGPADVPAVPGRLQRADRQGAREQADRRRPPGRERLAHQPGRHRHHRLGPAADERPGHDRRHRRDRLPARPVRDRRHDRRREGDDDDVDVRPSHHPGRRVRPVPAGGRGLSAGRARLLRAGLLRPRRGDRPGADHADADHDRRAAAGREDRGRAGRRRRAGPRSCCRPSRPRCR